MSFNTSIVNLQLEEIYALPGIDMIFFGPADFSQGIGMPTNGANEKTLATRRLVAETARKHGNMAGTTGGIDCYKELEKEGFNFINMGADVVALGAYFDGIADRLFK